jgi:hypothetical protein
LLLLAAFLRICFDFYNFTTRLALQGGLKEIYVIYVICIIKLKINFLQLDPDFYQGWGKVK